ncbi:hypothetical protein N665_6044s0001 [Sinapis alba]|nr:hypothetical protein N665_6044s0001 [Sinapis alba]
MNTDELKFAEVVGILKAEEMELESKYLKPAQDIKITVDENIQRAQKLVESIHLMIQKLGKTIDLLSKMSNDRLPRKEERQKKHEAVCFNCHGIGHVKTECPSFKRKEIKCNGCNGYGHIKSDCVNTKKMKMKMKRSCSDKKSEREEDSLNFVALHGVMESEKDIIKGESRASCVSHTNSDASHSDTERDLDADFLADYQVLFGKFEELSHENMQLMKDKAILKAQVNALEMDQTDTKGESKCRVTKNDDKDEFQSLKRVITEQNRVQQDSEIKLHQMKQLLNQELEKSQLLERQLNENYKKVRMLNTGSATLDHILSIQQCPKISWGLGYQGSTSQEYGEAERIRFIKAEVKSDDKLKAAAQQVNKAKDEEKSGSVTKSKEIQDRKVIVKRRNGCHFCGQIGHSVAYCYARRNQLERAWRMNLFYVEPRRAEHLNEGGFFEPRMRANLRGTDEDVWTVVQSGWEEPFVMQEDGLKTPKPKTKWTATEKKLSKFNAKALDTIFTSVDGKQFELIQGCESAKEAWDILQNAFEGTANVRRIRLDLLASQFEDIRMSDDEKIGDFTAKLSSIANEAQVLAHKAAMNLTMNTDELKFAEVVGILKAEEMELESKNLKKP